MKVKELIELLQELNQEASVARWDSTQEDFVEIKSVEEKGNSFWTANFEESFVAIL